MNNKNKRIILVLILAAILMSHTMVSFAGWQREEKWSYLNTDGEEIRSEWFRQLPVLLFLLSGLILFAGTRKRDMGTLALIMYLSVLMASLPLLLPYLIKGHDLTFHLNRILGIEESLKSGMFPVRLNGYSLNGYGYADPVFYPQLFLYIPALLHMMGVPFPTAVNIFLILVHAATAIVMYCCAKKMFGSPEIGCISSVIYTLCIYRLCNSYMRAAYGEMTAMVFLPLILYGFYELFFGDEKKWPVLVLGVTGVIQSHIISTMLTAILCMAGGLCCLGRMREKARLYSCVKAILAAVMLNLWFLLPLLRYMGTEIDTSPLQMIAGNHTVPAAKVMEAFSRSSGETPSPYRDYPIPCRQCRGLY